MPTLYLVRHTAPDIAPGVCYGQTDVDVAASFAHESAAVANLLPPVDLILSSPLLRARQLGEHLARHHGCVMRTDVRLTEMHFGKWEGQPWHDIARCDIDAWSADLLNYAPPAGESAGEMMRRVQEALRDVERLPQQTIALVMHAGSIRAALAALAAIPLDITLKWDIGLGAVIGVRL